MTIELGLALGAERRFSPARKGSAPALTSHLVRIVSHLLHLLSHFVLTDLGVPERGLEGAFPGAGGPTLGTKSLRRQTAAVA